MTTPTNPRRLDMAPLAAPHVTAGARRFHVTVLSNFARGYDRYARVYSKALIPESTYPDAFYVLAAEDLSIGVTKASKLLGKLGIPNNDLIAIEAGVAPERCALNLRNGLGSVWLSSELPVVDVWKIDANATLTPLGVEQATARSLGLHEGALHSYEALAPRSVSFLPIARGCQAACPFCFSEASASADQKQARVDWACVTNWLVRAKARGVGRAVITGGGEPTMLPFADLIRLIEVCRSELPKTVLITNGVKLATMRQEIAAHLLALKSAGLSVLAVSRHHPADDVNAKLMNLDTQTPRLFAAVRDNAERLSGLRTRLICVLQQGGVTSVRDIDDYVRWASDAGADEVCFKELYVSTSEESVYHSHASNVWSAAHQVPLSRVLTWATENGFSLETRLPWGAPVFRGLVNGRSLRVAAYTEPSLFWERTHGIARSWNVMADGSCFASLEDRRSRMDSEDRGAIELP